MKKRVLSALLVLCLACGLVSTAWATDPGETALPTPAPVTGQEKQDEQGEKVEINTPPADGEGDPAPTPAPGTEPTPAPGGEEGENEGTGAPTPTPQPESTEEPTAAPSPEPTPAPSAEPEPNSVQSVQPNQAPAANRAPAAPALQAETRATDNSFHITWGNYFDVTVYYVDQNGSSIEHDFGCQDQTLNNGGSLTFSNFATENTFETDTGTYTYEGAHYGSYNGDNVTSVSASESSSWGTTTRKFDFGRVSLEHHTYPIIGGEDKKTASIYLVYNYEEFQPEELPEDDAISIVETVVQDGMFTAVYNGRLEKGDTVTYTWEVSRNGVAGTWTPVESQKVTGENFNWQPDVDPEKINVAYDALLRNVSDDQRYFYRVTATVTRADGSNEEHQAQLQVPYYIQLQNGSFENPDIPGDQFNEQWPNGKPGLIWQTTGPGSINNRPGDDIEVILENRNGTQQNYGVNQAAHGEQFAELNCEAYGALYQDVMTVPGTTLNWSFAHLARDLDEKSDYARDTMAMVIMPADQADEIAEALQEAADSDNPADQIEAILNGLEGKAGCYVYTVTDSTWNYHHDWPVHSSQDAGAQPYTVPDDQYLTRFFFVSVDADYDHRQSATSFGTVGNLIDAVWFSTKVPEPDDDEAQLTVQKTVAGLDDLSDYSVTMTVQPEDKGEQARTITFDSSKFTANTDGTYTATATITYKVAANNGSKTVTVSESGYAVSGYVVSSTYDVTGAETAANGTGTQVSDITIPARQNATVTFTNTYTPTTGTITIVKNIYGLTEDEVESWVMNETKDERLRFDVDYFDNLDKLKEDEKPEAEDVDRNKGDWTFDVQDTLNDDGFDESGSWHDEVTGYDNNESINNEEKSHYTAISMEKKDSEGETYFQYKMTLDEVDLNYWYRVWEIHTDVPGYTLESTVEEYKNGEADSSLNNLLLTEDMGQSNHGGKATAFKLEADARNVTVEFTNRYTPTTGSLTIEKEVVGLPGSATANDTPFQFTITGPSGMFAEGETSKTFEAVDAEGQPAGSVTFIKAENGTPTASVAITGANSIKIKGLPLGLYTVQETSAPDIGEFYCDLLDTSVNKTIGNTPETELDQTATITNTYKPYKTLTIEKTVTGEMGSDDDAFTFTVKKTNGTLAVSDVTKATDSAADSKVEINKELSEDGSLSFTMTAGGKVTLSKLKDTDVVTITETNPGNGYKPSVDLSGVTGYLAPDGEKPAQHPGFETIPSNGVKVTVSQVMSKDNSLGEVKFINTRTAVAPTGLESDHTAPYALMVTAAGIAGLALIGGIAARRIRRRREW